MKHFEIQVSKKFINKSWFSCLLFFDEKKSERFNWFSKLENEFKNQNFVIFEDLLNNFGRSDGDGIKWKNYDFHYKHM